MAANNDVAITGIGLVTCLGEGVESNWKALISGSEPKVDIETFAPYPVHPLPEIDWSTQIPKRGDLRQMENWQRTGTYAAGLALDDAGLKEDTERLATMDMIVAAAGGERDVTVDGLILSEADQGRNDHEVLINEKLTTELRPTLFLAQLSNLLAGNISIVHKVTGSSRTFMGEDGCGMSSLQTAAARIRSGQSSHALVGGALNAEHRDILLSMELGHNLSRDEWTPISKRSTLPGGGIIMGSGSAFLVLENYQQAIARGAKIYARLGAIATDQGFGEKEKTAKRLERLLDETGAISADLMVSTQSGALERHAVEIDVLSTKTPNTPIRYVATKTGHLREAQYLLGIAIAAIALKEQEPFPPLEEAEKSAGESSKSIAVVGVGHDYAEGVAMLHATDEGASR